MPKGDTEPPIDTSQDGLNGSMGVNCPPARVENDPGKGSSTFALRFSVPRRAKGMGIRNLSPLQTEPNPGVALSVASSNPEGLRLAPKTKPPLVMDMWAPATGGPNGMPRTIG